MSSLTRITFSTATPLINKSGAALDSTFLVQWSDPDLGESGDDYAGCDVARNLGFVYNGKPVDYDYGACGSRRRLRSPAGTLGTDREPHPTLRSSWEAIGGAIGLYR